MGDQVAQMGHCISKKGQAILSSYLRHNICELIQKMSLVSPYLFFRQRRDDRFGPPRILGLPAMQGVRYAIGPQCKCDKLYPPDGELDAGSEWGSDGRPIASSTNGVGLKQESRVQICYTCP
ncbi:hypothetical protein TNCV_397951 [Trichonephila clavipes]|nr:hypothetical protein TNCV_397951 [Trichonephila clavipes]